MRHYHPKGRQFRRPTQKYHAAFDFIDETADERCHDYVAADEEPIRTLHSAMNSKVEPGSAVFFLCSDIR
jgi:hypothetical protein